MTEKELREDEKLKTVEDYSNLINNIKAMICENKKADNEINKILFSIAKTLGKKVNYILKISIPYTKKQSIFSKWRDYRLKKQEEKEEKLEQQAEEQEIVKVTKKLEELRAQVEHVQTFLYQPAEGVLRIENSQNKEELQDNQENLNF